MAHAMRRFLIGAVVALLAQAGAAQAQPPKPAYVTGSPTTGAIAKASGPQSLTTGDLSGDCTTSGTLATICLKTNGVNFGAFATGADAANLTGTVSVNRFNSGTSASSSTFLRGDGTWAAPSGGSGTVTTTGSPASGNLAKFSGSTSITSGDLSGDCTTSGTLAITCTKTSGTSLGTFATENYATPPAIGGTTPAAGSFSSVKDTGITGSTQCVHADSSGNFSGTGSDCGAGGGGGGSGSLAYLATVTVANGASINVTTRNQGSFSGAIFQSDYDVYEVHFVDILNVTNSVNIYLRVSTNGGSTYDSAANYTDNSTVAGSGVSVFNTTTGTQFTLNFTPTTTVANNLTYALEGSLKFFNPVGTTNFKTVIGQVSYPVSGQLVQYWPHGIYRVSASAVNAFQVLASSGNISGTVRVYGVVK